MRIRRFVGLLPMPLRKRLRNRSGRGMGTALGEVVEPFLDESDDFHRAAPHASPHASPGEALEPLRCESVESNKSQPRELSKSDSFSGFEGEHTLKSLEEFFLLLAFVYVQDFLHAA